MYNLFVSADENSWEGNPFEMDLSRCIREYTDKEIVEKYQDLTEAIIREIKRFLCLFAIDNHLILLSILQTCKYQGVNFFEFSKSKRNEQHKTISKQANSVGME